MSLRDRLSRSYRRRFGRYVVDDPRPIAAEAPYTFFLPSENELLALGPGDLAKIMFRSIPPAPEWAVERMWVLITATDGDQMQGTLDNEPSDMPQLSSGDPISFRRWDVIQISWNDERTTPPPPGVDYREYWDRCLVDDCVLTSDTRVHYLYREEAETPEGDAYPDSGWHIRGDYRDLPDATINARQTQYVALGSVLNKDDSWLSLIDAPVGSAFIRNWETGVFEPER